jgi:hypothetical protein
MKATLTFDLPEEQEQFEAASRGIYVCNAVRRHLDNTRRRLKHSIEDDNEARIMLRSIEELSEQLELYGVSNLIYS